MYYYNTQTDKGGYKTKVYPCNEETCPDFNLLAKEMNNYSKIQKPKLDKNGVILVRKKHI